MAYLTVRLSAGAYQPNGNFTPVSASVSITWNTSESYNQEHKTGTITIGSSSASFSTDFNAGRTENGTEVLGGLSTSIYHNSNGDPVTVTATASGAGRSASDTITLPGGTPSGGGSSGGDDDEEGGSGGNGGDSGGSEGGDSGDTDYGVDTYTLKFQQGEHTTIKVVGISGNVQAGKILNDGDTISVAGNDPTKIQIFFDVDDDYEINEHKIIGIGSDGYVTFNSGYIITLYAPGPGGIGSNHTLIIKTSATEIKKQGVFIRNNSGFELYNCYIDDGTNWNLYTPYIVIEKHYSWDGLFTASVNVTDSGLYLRSDTSTNYTNLILMPNKTELTIEDVAIADDGTTVLAKTTYNSKTGWANTKYLDFTIYGRVNNVSGTPFYMNYSLDSQIWYSFEYGREIVIGGNTDYTELIVSDGLIWGNVIILQEDGTSLGGYVKMQDIDFMSERTELIWHELTYTPDKESVKYLYKDGAMYSPLSDGFNSTYCRVSNSNNTLVYRTVKEDGERGSHAITKTAIDLSDFKYLCVKTGEIGVVNTDSPLATDKHFYIGINSGANDLALHYAMYLTENDSNKTLYVDLSSIDLFYDYYIGFGTPTNYGSYNYISFYIEEFWLSNEVGEDMIEKPFNYTLNKVTAGAVG